MTGLPSRRLHRKRRRRMKRTRTAGIRFFSGCHFGTAGSGPYPPPVRLAARPAAASTRPRSVTRSHNQAYERMPQEASLAPRLHTRTLDVRENLCHQGFGPAWLVA